MTEILILAHRGTGKGPGENSINAFKQGLVEKADGLELDIRITKDRVPVCVHDETLKRVFDKDLSIKDLTVTDLKGLKLFDSDNICSLQEVFERFGNEIFYDVEIKDPDVLPEFKEVVRHFQPVRLMVSSFKHACLNHVKERIPEALIAPIIDFKGVNDYRSYILDMIQGYLPYSLNLDSRFFHEDNSEKLNWFRDVKAEYDVKLAFWTVNTSEEFEKIAAVCDFLITDRPMLLIDQMTSSMKRKTSI